MIQINPDKIRVVQLTPKEQKTILEHCQSLDRDMYARIKNAGNGVLHMLEEEYAYLMELIYVEATSAITPEVRNILGHLYHRLTAGPTAQVFVEELEGYDFKSIKEVNDKLQQMMNKQNDTPDPDMGGLSPN